MGAGLPVIATLRHLVETGDRITRTFRVSRVTARAQATVGSGLPVIATLRHLVETGDRITRAFRVSRVTARAQATVGAGLPVIATLRHLVETGDRITRVEGVFSGTLSYIFNNLVPGALPTRFLLDSLASWVFPAAAASSAGFCAACVTQAGDLPHRSTGQ